MALHLSGLWTIQDFWIGHHNLLMRQVDGAPGANADLRFEGTSLFIGSTSIHSPVLSAVETESLPTWMKETYAAEILGHTVFSLVSAYPTGGSAYIAAIVLWRQQNALPRSKSSLIGKYLGPQSIEEVEDLVRKVASGDKPTGTDQDSWERLMP